MNLIWDLDGTIIDSYPIMTKNICQVTKEAYEDVYHFIKKHSVSQYFRSYSIKHDIAIEDLYSSYENVTQKTRASDYPLIDGFMDLLDMKDVNHYIYTHRGKTTFEILAYHHIDHAFIEVVTSLNGFKRKPDPQALQYLIDRHVLTIESTFYIGDRSLDMSCGFNAGVRTIFIGENLGVNLGDYTVVSMSELKDLLLLLKNM